MPSTQMGRCLSSFSRLLRPKASVSPTDNDSSHSLFHTDNEQRCVQEYDASLISRPLWVRL